MSTVKSTTVTTPTTGKRKRNADPDPEIEIDVNLPEPPSKKALRKAKKEKSSKKSSDIEGTKSNVEDESHASADEKPTSDETNAQKRSEYGIWIGNLPWTCGRPALENFFVTNSTNIKSEQITRVHMPVPPPNPKDKYNKPLNKGFAYVDFATKENLEAALSLSETAIAGRKVLIKNAKDFGGRPKPVKGEAGDENGVKPAPPTKAATDRLFVGNLGFEVTKEEVREHFEQCGTVTDVFLATFEDSGKCKGYGWVTFADVEGAKAGERGYIMKQPEDDGSDEDESQGRKVKKPRKWWVNKLNGRPLRCEFAEDASTRYNKRFGKGRPRDDAAATTGVSDATADPITEVKDDKGARPPSFKRKVDARTIKPGAAHMSAPRLTGGIVESTGKKTVFD